MTRREKQRELFIELINYQLKDFGETYDSVKDNPTWYMDYKTSQEKEAEFLTHCTKRISDVLKIGKKQAELEASWFILQWGLTTKIDSKEINLKKSSGSKMKDSDSTQ